MTKKQGRLSSADEKSKLLAKRQTPDKLPKTEEEKVAANIDSKSTDSRIAN
jgi:hypothetical protein